MAEREGAIRQGQNEHPLASGVRYVGRRDLLPTGEEATYKSPFGLGCSARLSQGEASPLDYDGKRARWIEGLSVTEYLALWDNNGTLLHEPLGLIDDKIKE